MPRSHLSLFSLKHHGMNKGLSIMGKWVEVQGSACHHESNKSVWSKWPLEINKDHWPTKPAYIKKKERDKHQSYIKHQPKSIMAVS